MDLIQLPWADGGVAPIGLPIGEQTPSQFTAITPVLTARRADLASALNELEGGDASPFADVPGVHMARFEVLDSIPVGGVRPVMQQRDPAALLFGVSYDGTLPDLVTRICQTMTAACDAVWGCCADYPGSGRAEQLTAWLQRHAVEAQLAFRTHDASREQIVSAIDRRRRLKDFAARARGDSPSELLEAFRGEFAPAVCPGAQR